MLGQLGVAAQNSRRDACVLDSLDHVVDDLDDFGMVGLAEIAKRGGKIARADEHAIDALNARDAFEVLEPALRLHLQQKTDLGVGRLVRIP